MASLYFLVATHEYAGYEERSRLRSTLHTTHSLFATGNPQSKLPAKNSAAAEQQKFAATYSFKQKTFRHFNLYHDGIFEDNQQSRHNVLMELQVNSFGLVKLQHVEL